MKGARLWKRILNEGVGGDPKEDRAEATINQIIRAPIIVDSRPYDPQPFPLRGLSTPFPITWIEGFRGEENGGFLWGGLVLRVDREQGCQITIACFMAVVEYPPVITGVLEFDLDVAGNVVDGTQQTRIIRSSDHPGREHRMIAGTGNCVCDVLMLLACKNVSLSPRSLEPKQMNRAAKRFGGNPDYYRYHVLVVRPPGARSDAPAQEIGMMPRHVCRGHFAEYGPEFNKGLLFGKYAGRFFIPPHLKGDKKNGVVEKDYRVPAA